MKTTIDVSDALFQSAKDLALQRQTTMRALVEEGLRRVLTEAGSKPKPAFKMKDARVRGKTPWVADPRRWQQMDEDDVVARVMKPQA